MLFDKSTIESLSLNEAVLLDNFYRSTITPLFFVECLADLEREMFRMKGTPEQLVGSLAERTPDCQSAANVHHMDILKGEAIRIAPDLFGLYTGTSQPANQHASP